MSSQEAQGRWLWFWNRLRCMSGAEVAYRTRQVLVQKFHNWFGEHAAETELQDAAAQAKGWIATKPPCVQAASYVEEAERIASGSVRLFSIRRYDVGPVPEWNRCPLTGVRGPVVPVRKISLTNRDQVGDIKFVWELNRHLHLVSLAQAFALTGDDTHLSTLGIQIDSWLDQCPCGRGPNWTSALELSIRLINWSVMWQLIGGHESRMFDLAGGPALRDRWLAAIRDHVIGITGNYSRHSSANNHLIGELAGVYIGSRTWPCWPTVRRVGKEALREIEEQILLQTTLDGVNREQAFEYSTFVFDFFLLVQRTAVAVGDPISDAYTDRMAVMCAFIRSVMTRSGAVPQVGDADGAQVLRLDPRLGGRPFDAMLNKGAALFGRKDWIFGLSNAMDEVAWLFGRPDFAPLDSNHDIRMSFAAGGYELFGIDRGESTEILGLVDVGPLGYLGIAAHGHADALQVFMAVQGIPVLVDPGTYSYWCPKVWRDYFRGTTAHNTVNISGLDQSSSAGRFMWVRKARVHDVNVERTSDGRFSLSARHDGYRRLPGRFSHARKVNFNPADRSVCVVDEVVGVRSDDVAVHWHISPMWDVQPADEGSVELKCNGTVVSVCLTADSPARLELVRGQVQPPLGWYSESYGEKVPTTTIRFGATGSQVRIKTRIVVHFPDII